MSQQLHRTNPVPPELYKQLSKPLPPIENTDPTTAWFNAILSRLFQHVSRTGDFKDFVESKIKKKLVQMKRPAMLGPITMRELDVGTYPPMLFNAQLLRLTQDGDIEVAMDVVYEGGFKIEIETLATLDAGVTSIQLPVTMSVQVEKLMGKVLLRMKPAPSNRIWFGFFGPGPALQLAISPIVSDTTFNYGIITSAIKNRINEIIREDLVLPNMNDIDIPGCRSFDLLVMHSSKGENTLASKGLVDIMKETSVKHAANLGANNKKEFLKIGKEHKRSLSAPFQFSKPRSRTTSSQESARSTTPTLDHLPPPRLSEPEVSPVVADIPIQDLRQDVAPSIMTWEDRERLLYILQRSFNNEDQ